MCEWRRLRQPFQACGNPAAVLLRKVLGFFHAAARRHGEDDLTRGGIDTQRVAPCLSMASDPDEIDRAVESDGDNRRLARTPIKQGTPRHGGIFHHHLKRGGE
jgi:hypothetical protein